jgi:hypothetical protein
MAHTGDWEQAGIRILKIGRRYRVPVPSILEVLGDGKAPGTDADAEASAAGQGQASGNAADSTLVEPPGPPGSPTPPTRQRD